jgi:hypothetical protein
VRNSLYPYGSVADGRARAAQTRWKAKLAVLRGDDRAIFVGQRLPAARDVDDAQAGGTDRKQVAGEDVLIVRPPVMEGGQHRRDRVPVAMTKKSGDPAHVSYRFAGA